MKRSGLPRKSSLLRKGRLKPVSKKQVSIRKLNALARHLVVVLRDRGVCQRCGNSSADPTHRNRNGVVVPGPPEIHWAHIRAGRAKSLAHQPWAAMALCAGCHFWFDANGNGKIGTASRMWWAEKFPLRDLSLRLWEQERKRPKFDAEFTKRWLEQEISKAEGPCTDST